MAVVSNKRGDLLRREAERLDWAALFPFFSPILMFPRAVAGSVPAWMVATSLVLMVVALVITAFVAGRI